MPRVTFLLPGHGRLPVGGYKVVYEYANGLVRRGWDVCVVHTARLLPDAPAKRRAIEHAAFVIEALRGYRPRRWFRLDPRVKTRWVHHVDEHAVPDADALFATAWQTAELIADLPPQKGKRFYLIQHRETWSGPEERVMATWKLPMVRVVIAKWLQELGDSLGVESHHIPNGLDQDEMTMQRPMRARDAARVVMMYHTLDWKGSLDGVRALTMAKESEPKLTATLFGVPPRPATLPGWVEYRHRPTRSELCQLYNNAAIFVGPSWTEGWPLPPAEAMLCGCADALTDIPGHREYATHGATALLSPPRDPQALAANILRLARDAELRLAIAGRGRESIHQFTWARAVDALALLVQKEPSP